MKRILSATILATSVLATPALAQVGIDLSGDTAIGIDAEVGRAGVGVGVEASGSASGDTSGANAGAAGNADAHIEHAVAAIRASHDTAAEIAAVTDAPVNVVSIDTIAEGSNKVALESVIEDHEQASAELRSSIESNAALSAALQSQGVELASVVAASVNADGSVTVFTE